MSTERFNKTGKKEKCYMLSLILFTIIGLSCMAGFIYYTDPFVQYHLPYNDMYTVFSRGTQSYVNAGLAKNCEYDSVIVGSSVSENFYASDFDRTFHCKAIKLPYAGGTTKTYSVILDTVFENRDIKNVFYSLDMFGILMDASKPRYDLPMYLYDDNKLNDVYYLLNRETVPYAVDVLENHEQVSLDDAYNWEKTVLFGKDHVLKQVKRAEKNDSEHLKWDSYDSSVIAGINNVTEQVNNHPDTQFYIFFPPYSMVWFDGYQLAGRLEAICGAYEKSMELLLECPNIKLYSFANWEEVITDLNNYRESMHFSERVNHEMVEAMGRDEFRITKDNYKDYIQNLFSFVSTYDYDAIYND
jgi:hypothetical protein